MRIEPASFAQVRAGRGGRKITVDQDVMDVARQIQAIDSTLHVEWNDQGEYFAVIQTLPGEKPRIVTTSNELDQRLVAKIARIGSEDYDYLGEIDRIDKQADIEKDRKFSEEVGEGGERLYHALRKDLQVQRHIFVPRSVSADRT